MVGKPDERRSLKKKILDLYGKLIFKLVLKEQVGSIFSLYNSGYGSSRHLSI